MTRCTPRQTGVDFGSPTVTTLTVSSSAQNVANAARSLGHDGVVCGHIHCAEMRDINGILCCNDGDWVECRCALVEHMDGRLELIYWNAEQTSMVVVQGAKEVAA